MNSSILTRQIKNTIISSRKFSSSSSQKIISWRNKYYQNPVTGAENPTFLKEPGDKFSLTIASLGVLTAATVIFGGLFSMISGNKS
mmetsp:Transcript_4740/g.4241  ORF Transcript_4740/g.4241 Transcript_4740/m.4241 type:complete len:86 (+) Transcript_4740:72-329(+)